MRLPGSLTVACALLVTMAGVASGRKSAGTVEGRITFVGKVPSPLIVPEGGTQQLLHVSAANGLRYAVVFLPDGQPTTNAPERTATMGQRSFVFEPQVLAVRAGATVRFTNDDPASHNVRARDANPANAFSIDTASGAIGPRTHRFADTHGRPLQLSCDIHPWMTAWIYVFDHDLFAVTDAEGAFRIDNVPAGHHAVAIRQPSGRLTRNTAVDVRAGEATRLDVRFTSADIGLPSRN
jgi:plastocyanin